VPADIRRDGGVARMSDPSMIKKIMEAVSIPVMAKVRIGHFVEAQILEAIDVDYIDESEVLTPADDDNHINKHNFRIPFVCGARNLGEALRRISEGAAMIRTKVSHHHHSLVLPPPQCVSHTQAHVNGVPGRGWNRQRRRGGQTRSYGERRDPQAHDHGRERTLHLRQDHRCGAATAC
jgi:hypothetical protein